jgi:hypothetical protein
MYDPKKSPANDRLAQILRWVGLFSAIAVLVFVFIQH